MFNLKIDIHTTADQNHMTVSRARVPIYRGNVFFVGLLLTIYQLFKFLFFS